MSTRTPSNPGPGPHDGPRLAERRPGAGAGLRLAWGLLSALWVLVLLVLAQVLLAGSAQAHPMRDSQAWIDTTDEGLALTLLLPLNRLELAFGQPLADRPQQVLAQHGPALAAYLLQHVGARSGEASWTTLRPTLQVLGDNASAELRAEMRLKAPPGTSPRAPVTLLIDAVVHDERTHRIQLALRNDWAGGLAAEPPRLLAELRHGRTSAELQLKADPAGPWRAAYSVWRHGLRHIAEGTDHLLFVLLLMTVAPLQATAGRWGKVREAGSALRRTVAVVTAFTVGHSLTLALAALGWVPPTAQAVEVGVAITIAVAALHAWRPLLARGDLAMAGGFGLVHGLAFASGLSLAGLSVGQRVSALLAFNLGIEAMQVLLVLLVLPPLLLLANMRPRAFARGRQLIAVLAVVAALLWLTERLGGDPWGATRMAEGGQASLLGQWAEVAGLAFRALPVALWLAALGLLWHGRPPARPPSPSPQAQA